MHAYCRLNGAIPHTKCTGVVLVFPSETVEPVETSLCAASYLRRQRGTARIRTPLLLSAGRAAVD